MRYLKSAPEVIDALGGDTKFARWCGVSRQRVVMWRKRGFPAVSFVALSERLRAEHQINVSPEAWGMIEAVAS